ncbi:VgrG-related protein [Pleurocapsales cyanobacterium LEGE 10410]|nr:VgrG-related protein [Pleurocapsales cyanobacterium LEGE 10410]
MGLFVANCLININGSAASEEFKNDLLQVCVEESLHLPGMFTLVINNPYAPGDSETTTWQYQDLIKIGTYIEIGFEASTDDEDADSATNYIIAGEITAIETHFTGSSQAPILVRGYDVSHRLHRGKHNRSFQDVTDSDLVTKIAEEVGIELNTVDASEQFYPYVFQQNQTNMQFLRYRAARIGFELYVRDGKLNFCQPQAGEELQLTWMEDLNSFRVRITTAEQVNSVEVRSWDYARKQAIVETARDEDRVITETNVGNGRDLSATFESHNYPSKMVVVDRPVNNSEEAKAIAEALFDELEGEFICADAKAIGNPEIRVGKVVNLSDMGSYDGKYYITETRHLFSEGKYHTEFAVRGLRGGNLLQILSPGERLQPSQTMLVGIVTDNQDPEGLGRVRVIFPTLNPETDGSGHQSWWARVVGMGAGSNRGWYCLPEINDEVLVAFEHGDIHRPYIIGNVWNGVDLPPEAKEQTIPTTGPERGKVRLRTFKSRTGHSLQFIENDLNSSQAGIKIETSRGHQVLLNDSTEHIELKTAGNAQIRLDDRHQRIEITTPGGHLYCLDDTTNTIQIQSTGAVNINAAGSINLSPALGQVGVSGLLSCTSILTGGLMFGTNPTSAVNVMQAIATLQTQVASLSDELGIVQTDLANNLANDLQQTEALADLQSQLETDDLVDDSFSESNDSIDAETEETELTEL